MNPMQDIQYQPRCETDAYVCNDPFNAVNHLWKMLMINNIALTPTTMTITILAMVCRSLLSLHLRQGPEIGSARESAQQNLHTSGLL